jgi:2-iminobutanoate/2-iminopropanoate deaminase
LRPEKEDAVRIQLVQTDGTRPAGGRPYSPALRAGDWLFIAGQVASGPGGELVGRGDAEAQWRRCLENIRDLVEAAEGSMADVVHTNIFVTDMRHHLAHSDIRKEFFAEPYPTATVVGVTSLAHEDWLVEIEAVAYLGGDRRSSSGHTEAS